MNANDQSVKNLIQMQSLVKCTQKIPTAFLFKNNCQGGGSWGRGVMDEGEWEAQVSSYGMNSWDKR